MKYRIEQKANGIFIPQVKTHFFEDWRKIDSHLNLWYIEATYTQHESFCLALETIEKFKLKNKSKYFNIK
jgi:hypothetical protein